MKIVKARAKNAFGKTKIPGAKFVVNQYIGCIHGCKYCYAKFMCKWYGHGEWGEWVIVRENVPELIRGKFVSGWVYMSSISDAYQPIEAEIGLTRDILKAMNKKIELRVLTKSDLVVRDTDVLKEFEKVEVGLTVNSFDEGVRREIEPRAPSMERRFRALEKLHDAGIRTYAFIALVIPNLTDLGYVIEQTKDFVEYYIIELLNLKASGNFGDWLKENYPASYSIITNELKRYVNKKIHRTIEKHGIVVEDIIVHPQSL